MADRAPRRHPTAARVDDCSQRRAARFALYEPAVALRDADLTAADRAFVAELCARCPPLTNARRLAHAFRAMLAQRRPGAFLPWLAAAHAA